MLELLGNVQRDFYPSKADADGISHTHYAHKTASLDVVPLARLTSLAAPGRGGISMHGSPFGDGQGGIARRLLQNAVCYNGVAT